MRFRISLRAAALIFVAFTAPAWAAGDEHAAGGAGSAQPGWMTAIADQKLQAVDGSSLTLSASEGGISLAVTSPEGDTQQNTYTLMSDQLGTISDGAGGGHLIGFFRTTDKGLEAQFADGHTESLALNAAGGLSLTLASAKSGTACMAWYPPGHNFSEAERRVALAEYARRLGLNDVVAKSPQSCDLAAQPAKTATRVTPTRKPEHSAANSKGLVPVMVRTSIVHAVDGAAPSAALPGAAASAAAIIPVSTGSAQSASGDPAAPARGASDCLSVDNDGADLGFRNQCGFAVQFAYCLQNAADADAACDAGTRVGNVAANGFVALLPGKNIKDADAEHEFRWVGCSGGANEVAAHLDRTDPPAGRCVRITAS